MTLSLPTQAILTATALKNMSAIPGLDGEVAVLLRDHSADLMKSALEHIRGIDDAAAWPGSSAPTGLAERVITTENLPEAGQ